MYGLNIDPNNPRGNPDPAELRELGVEMVRYTYHDPGTGDRLDPGKADFFWERAKAYHQVGIGSLVILTYDTLRDRPEPGASDSDWSGYIDRFAQRAGQIARLLAPWRPAFQVWNEPDHPVQPGYSPTLREAVFGRMLQRTYETIKITDPALRVVAAGLAAGNPGWLTRVIQSLGGQLPADIVAFHPYGQRPDPDWPNPNWAFGYLGDLLNSYYRAANNKPLWITEMGLREEDMDGNRDQVAEALNRYYRAITTRFQDKVEQFFWFCYSDGMVPSFGLRDNANSPKPAYHVFRELALARSAPPPEPPPVKETGTVVSLDRLNTFAQYLEQNIVFGHRNQAIGRQMETELRDVRTKLTKTQIKQVIQQSLVGSDFSVSTQVINSLYALQQQKDLLAMLRSIVLAAHQGTGALTGRLGVHTRISAETESNANTNIGALMGILRHVQPGNRLIILDMVKVNDDEAKLRAPDIFETNVYGQHRNGLIDNHAWNLQKLVRAIRGQGYQDRVILILRLDGPDGGSNVNIFSTTSQQKYELAITKVIRYLETVLPETPFKLVLGNEPDLPQERLWSSPHVEPRAFTIDQFAPGMGTFMRKLARQRPDVTFLCPALSANLKHDHFSYYHTFFGDERPDNLVPCMHGYAGDIAVLPGSQRNLLEQQADILRTLGRFRCVSGTEIGSSNPFGDCESLSDKGSFADVAAWLMLSKDHLAPPGQDNNWSFRLESHGDDPAARRFADMVNRTQARVLRNIRAHGGAGLPIMRDHLVDRPAYSVQYESHNTPAVMVAGQTSAARITLRNTSYRTWAAGGPNPVRLGYHWYTEDGREVDAALWTDYRTNLPYNLLPDQSVTLDNNVAAPRVPGAYEIRWDMVEEMKTWFAWQGAPTLNVAVTINPENIPVPAEPAGLSLTASHNNNQQGEDNLRQALDGNAYSRWSSRIPQKPGMWFQIDLGAARSISHLRLRNDASPQDYPRGYMVKVSADKQQWVTVAENSINDRPLDVVFPSQPVRWIRIEQTGSDSVYWWSVHEIEVSDETLPGASASHNSVMVGGDNLRQAFDNRPETRWSSMAVQQPGMWFEIDLGQERPVAGLALDTAASPMDYPRGYIVRLSTDRSQWIEVARNDRNDRALDVTFSPRQARYIRIEQTGSADAWWWSIHEVSVKSAASQPQPEILVNSGRASHNNTDQGGDNLRQAFDNRPETRWSSMAVQQPGMWFEIDLGQERPVAGLALDTAASPMDYPRGYIVRLSTDRSQWIEVARNDRNDRALDVTFSPRQARYIRIEQTGSADAWWWSIHGIKIV